MNAEKPGFFNNTFAPIALTLEEWGYTNTRVPPQPARIQAHLRGLRLYSTRHKNLWGFSEIGEGIV